MLALNVPIHVHYLYFYQKERTLKIGHRLFYLYASIVMLYCVLLFSIYPILPPLVLECD